MKRKLAENLRRIQERIEQACVRADRKPARVKLVVVTKSVGLDVIRTLLDLGRVDLGESRVQELAHRAGMIAESMRRRELDTTAQPAPKPRWHLVGHLQRNKVKAVLPWVHMIHSVDSLRLAEEIDAQARRLERVVPILLQINASDEPQKHGVSVAAAIHLAEQVCTLEHICLRGLMAMGPTEGDDARLRFVFERTRDVFEEIAGERICGPEFTELSLGMSGDFEYAIDMGATYVRIGSAIFEGIELATPAAHAD